MSLRFQYHLLILLPPQFSLQVPIINLPTNLFILFHEIFQLLSHCLMMLLQTLILSIYHFNSIKYFFSVSHLLTLSPLFLIHFLILKLNLFFFCPQLLVQILGFLFQFTFIRSQMSHIFFVFLYFSCVFFLNLFQFRVIILKGFYHLVYFYDLGV